MPASQPYDDRDWLLRQARALLDFHAAAFDPAGGFRPLSLTGAPLAAEPRGQGAARALHDVCRMVHCYALAEPLGHPAARRIVDHGMTWLLTRQQDAAQGGFYWSVDDAGPIDARKQAYGHAFVLLAAASARRVGHPEAERLRDLALAALWSHFWDDAAGAVSDTFDADWSGGLDYRGQNANMHLTEALLAAHAVWGDPGHLAAARRIAVRLIDQNARAAGWVVPEHFTVDWRVDPDFDGDAMFRPSGVTPGHALEWSRLVLNLWDQGGRADPWMPEAAEALFRTAVMQAWLPEGGFAYTLGWDGAITRRWRFWWPCAEAIAAAWVLAEATGEAFYREWYDRVWRFVDVAVIDHENGGWFHEIGADGKPSQSLFPGKPDIYHALQACLIPAGMCR